MPCSEPSLYDCVTEPPVRLSFACTTHGAIMSIVPPLFSFAICLSTSSLRSSTAKYSAMPDRYTHDEATVPAAGDAVMMPDTRLPVPIVGFTLLVERKPTLFAENTHLRMRT